MNELPLTAKIRKVLTEGFDDEELTCLCFDYYREVHNRFAAGMTKTAKIYALITYCEQRKKLPALVGILRIERPETYTAIFGNQPPLFPLPVYPRHM